MSDLTKLTAEELIDQIALTIKRANDPYWLAIAEIRRRLERLEKCEAALFWARQLLRDLPAKRDWLDPDIERGLRAALEGE